MSLTPFRRKSLLDKHLEQELKAKELTNQQLRGEIKKINAIKVDKKKVKK